jgi:hypothetical protein
VTIGLEMRIFIGFMLGVIGGCGYFVGNLRWGPAIGIATGVGAIFAVLLVVWVLVNLRG